MNQDAHPPSTQASTRQALAASHPTSGWSRRVSLERAQQANALLAAAQQQRIMECKRKNAAVRRREFAMLREIRQRQMAQNPGADADIGSTPPVTRIQPIRPGVRTPVLTLQKINEIEAQMSRQWWDAQSTVAPSSQILTPRDVAAQPSGARPPPPDNIPLLSDALPPDSAPAPKARTPDPSAMSARSLLEDLMRDPREREQEQLPTLQDLFGLKKPWDGTIEKPAAPPAPEAAPASRVAAPAAAQPPIADDTLALLDEPQVQEAAVLFAGGDIDAAEQALRALLAQRQALPLPAQLPLWLALVQLYRAANRAEAFERAALDLAARFGRSPPQWFAMLQTHHGARQTFHWTAPSTVTVQTLEALQSAKAAAVAPWTLDFAALTGIQSAAAEPLQALLQQWVESEGRFVLLHVEKLLQLLTAHSPSGDAAAPQVWWLARMLLLRLLGEQEEFDSVALDYCVTYEVSPPWWEPPRCQCVREAAGAATLPAPSASTASQEEQDPRQLAGIFEGDISAWLHATLPAQAAGEALVLDCSQLTRMDAGAAYALLQWAKQLHAQGRAVRLQHLHYLLAAFLHKIGMTSCAKLLLRSE